MLVPDEMVPRVSVVVPVYNRRHQLGRLLSTLARQRFPLADFEVLICDDGSTETIEDIVEAARIETGLRIRHLRQSRSGAAAARNMGLRYASGEVTVFTDSDCEAVEEWLEAIIAPFESEDAGMVGGSIQPHPASPLPSRCCNLVMASVWGGGARDPRSLVSMHYHPRTGNAAVRTAYAQRCGGLISERHGEDIDFASRMMAAGHMVAFAPDAIVYHNDDRSLVQIATEAFWKGRARVRLWRARRAMEPVHAAPAALVAYLVAWPFLMTAVPSMAWVASLPALAYLAVSLMAGLHVAYQLRSRGAICVAPACTFLMHVGYGVGLISAFAAKHSTRDILANDSLATTGRASITATEQQAPALLARKTSFSTESDS